jgi:asparagine synthase (glutamine-hydrolysing)
MQAYLPEAIRARPKQPYRAPDIPAFFEGRQQDYVQELLGERAIRDYGYFDARAVAHLLRKIRMGRAIGYKDNMALVSILSTQLWHHLFVEGFARRFGKDAATEWSNTDRGDFNDDHATRTQLHTGELLVHGRSAGPGR